MAFAAKPRRERIHKLVDPHAGIHLSVTAVGESVRSLLLLLPHTTMLNKTEKGRAELQPGPRVLDQRHRAILLMVDGRNDKASLEAVFGGQGAEILRHLLAHGYVAEDALAPQKPSPKPAEPQRELPPSPPATQQNAADAFTGPRSLASARMFLFDISERMFAPREKAVAQRFRDALREARDTRAMLDVSREMLVLIEAKAGPARADAISERLAKLLPESVIENI